MLRPAISYAVILTSALVIGDSHNFLQRIRSFRPKTRIRSEYA